MTLDDTFDEEDDLRLEIDGLPVVVDKALHTSLENAVITVEPDKGIVVSCDGK